MTEKLVIRLKREGRNGGSNVLRLVREAKTHSIVSDQDAGDAESAENRPNGRLPGRFSSGESTRGTRFFFFSRTLSRLEFFSG